MYIVTNRKLSDSTGGYDIFEDTQNTNGSNELRLLEFDNEVFTLLDDQLASEKVIRLKEEFSLDIYEDENHYASLEVASKIFTQARDENKQILVFIHGYNNDMEDTVKKALEIEETYKVIVVIFSWPANGGGIVTGTASYLSDKKDARTSAGALNQFFEKLHHYHTLYTQAEVENLWKLAQSKYKNNSAKAKEQYVKLQQELCQVSINLLCHSMGNYLLKHTTMSSDMALSMPIFDNICLVAADTNSEKHKEWIEKIQIKNNLYVVINKRDGALAASRVKPGKEQLARLGHYRKSLNAKNATYIDVSNADNIGVSHSYFTGVENDKLKAIFLDMFEGRDAEEGLEYKESNNSYIF